MTDTETVQLPPLTCAAIDRMIARHPESRDELEELRSANSDLRYSCHGLEQINAELRTQIESLKSETVQAQTVKQKLKHLIETLAKLEVVGWQAQYLQTDFQWTVWGEIITNFQNDPRFIVERRRYLIDGSAVFELILAAADKEEST